MSPLNQMREKETKKRMETFLQDTRALSEVLGFIMVLAIVLSATSIYISQQIPIWTEDCEARHTYEVADDFSNLDSQIDGIVLVAKQGGENTTAAGTTPIKLLPDRVPFFSISPPGSTLQFLPGEEEAILITPTVEEAPPPPAPVNLSWVESTTADFSHPNATPVNVDVTSNEIKLSLMTHVDLPLNNTRTILGGEYYYNLVELKNNSILYVAPSQVLKIYALTISVDATSKIIADDRGYLGGSGGEIGDGTGYGNPGYNGSGGGGAGYGNVGGTGGLGGINASSGDAGTGGDSYGDNSSSFMEFGSGGGGGGYGEGSKVKPFVGDAGGGDGGTGGGALLLDAEEITIAGAISADGAVGKNGQNVAKGRAGGGGGGGSGGAIIIRGRNVSITGTLSAQGGIGGTGGSSSGSTGDYGGGGGGGGAGGRIKVFYENASLYTPPLPPSRYSVDGGMGGTGGTGASDCDGSRGGNGSIGPFYENQTTYVSSVLRHSAGSYVSRVYDTGNTTTCYGTMSWDAASDEYTSLVLRVRTWRTEYMEGNATLWDNCPAVTNGQDISELASAFDGHRYVQYRAEFFTYDISRTPVLREVRINYTSSNPCGDPVIDDASGIVKFKSSYLYFPNQELVYEHGAVIRAQTLGDEKRGFVIHDPRIAISTESGSPKIQISLVDLIGSARSYSGATTSSVETSYNEYKSCSTEFDNLSINVTTMYPHIWSDWFNTTLAESGLNASYYKSPVINESAGTVVVEFYGHGDGVQLYEEKATIRVQITT